LEDPAFRTMPDHERIGLVQQIFIFGDNDVTARANLCHPHAILRFRVFE
jgi:hypothetical protein